MREHAITRTIVCNLVKPDNAFHYLGNNLPPSALMLHQGFARPLQLCKHVVAIAEQARHRAPSEYKPYDASHPGTLQQKFCLKIWCRRTREPCIVNCALGPIKGQGLQPNKASIFDITNQAVRVPCSHLGIGVLSFSNPGESQAILRQITHTIFLKLCTSRSC
jgi:hypothetical protein